MIIFTAKFKKNDGSARNMKFCRLHDLPMARSQGERPKLAEGQELVWDLQKNAYRVFNWKTAIGSVKATRI